MKFGKEFELQVGGATMRGIEAWGTEDELAKLVGVEGPEKGWSVHSQGQESVILRKPRQEDCKQSEEGCSGKESESPEDLVKRRAELAKQEWEAGMLASEQLPEGLVVCARCNWIDKSLEMHGMARCGSPASRSSITGNATFYGPFYQRKCNDFRTGKKA